MLTSARSFSHLFGSLNSLRPGSDRDIFSAYIITMLTPGNFNIGVKENTFVSAVMLTQNMGGKTNQLCFFAFSFFSGVPWERSAMLKKYAIHGKAFGLVWFGTRVPHTSQKDFISQK